MFVCMAVILLNIGLQAATPANTADEKHDTFQNMLNHPQEHWYSLTLMNTKIGYMHTSAEKAEYQGERGGSKQNRYSDEL